MDYTIRPMEKQDKPAVQEVAKISWHATYEGIIPLHIQDNFVKVAYSEEMMQKRLAHSVIFVAEAGGTVVGFADFSPVNENGQSELNAIYLLPDWQRDGIGTALLQKGLTELEGVRDIYVNVEKDNTTGMRFYEAKGFCRVKEYDDDFDGHILKTVRLCLNVE